MVVRSNSRLRRGAVETDSAEIWLGRTQREENVMSGKTR